MISMPQFGQLDVAAAGAAAGAGADIGAGASKAGAAGALSPAPPDNVCPQVPQKVSPGIISMPQLGQLPAGAAAEGMGAGSCETGAAAGAGDAAGVGSPSVCPQVPQKASPGIISIPQFGQLVTAAAEGAGEGMGAGAGIAGAGGGAADDALMLCPHVPQKASPMATSMPQLGHVPAAPGVGAAVGIAAGAAGAGAAAAPRLCPHVPQKASPGVISMPQLGQLVAAAAIGAGAAMG